MSDWSLSTAAAERLLWRESSPSTNAELLELAAELPHFAVLATDWQTAGRARLDRTWTSPAGASLAISVLLRPTLPDGRPLPPDAYGWISLATGLAMSDAIAAVAPDLEPVVKWPNDVLVGDRKIAGILAEIAPDGSIVVGIGVNVAMTEDQLPVPTATSLRVLGVDMRAELADELLAGFLRRFRSLIDGLLAAGGDAVASGLRERVVADCTTLGHEVRVELPGTDPVFGRAVGLDAAGRLELRRADDDSTVSIAAGDIVHLRYG